jgi:peptidoglycan/LPS O-acetylase OafA/YrhL
LFPIYLAISRGGVWSAILLIVAGTAGLWILAQTPKAHLDLTYHNGIFRGMAAFGIGVGLAVLHNKIRARGGASLPTYVHSLAQAAAFAALLYGIYGTGWAHSTHDIYTVLPMAPLIFALSFDRGFLASALKTGLPRRLGEWSYAIYIGQTALEQWLDHAQFHLFPQPTDIVLGRTWAAWDPIWHWLEPALLLAAAILWGYILFSVVERPAARFLKGFIAQRQRGTATA